MKIFVIIILLSILWSLGSAAFYLFKGTNSEKMIRALKWRVGLSLFLFLSFVIMIYLGIITPNTPSFLTN